MRTLPASILVLGCVGGWVVGADRLDEVLASWQETPRGVTSLVVEFSAETRDTVFNERRQGGDGVFRFLRGTGGEVYASYQLTWPRREHKGAEPWTGLLRNGTMYMLM